MVMSCPRLNCPNKAVIDTYFGVLPCNVCLSKDLELKPVSRPEFYSVQKMDRIVCQRDQFDKDLLQPFNGTNMNAEFAKAYPNRAKDYFSEEQLSKI